MPPLTIEPATWTELAPAMALLAAVMIALGDFEAIPFPDDPPLPPHPATAPAITSAAKSRLAGRVPMTRAGYSNLPGAPRGPVR